MLASAIEDRVALVVSVAPELVARGVKAGAVVKAAAAVVGGGGGGRDTLAQAGGRDAGEARQEALAVRARRSRPCSAELMRVLALDYGSARCGCALSDPTGTIVTPIEIVPRPGTRRGLARIEELVREREVERVVVGLPLSLSGEDSEQTRETRAFAQALSCAWGRGCRWRCTTSVSPRAWPSVNRSPSRPPRPVRTRARRRTCWRAG